MYRCAEVSVTVLLVNLALSGPLRTCTTYYIKYLYLQKTRDKNVTAVVKSSYANRVNINNNSLIACRNELNDPLVSRGR